MALLAQKLWTNFFLSKSVSGYFKTEKKIPMATKARGGVKVLEKNFFAVS